MESRKILRNYYLIRVDRVDQSWVLIEEGWFFRWWLYSKWLNNKIHSHDDN